jgi:hypothetical protein
LVFPYTVDTVVIEQAQDPIVFDPFIASRSQSPEPLVWIVKLKSGTGLDVQDAGRRRAFFGR